MSRSEGRWAWSAWRWEIRMRSACAAFEGGTGPRTRRRWPMRAVRTGSNRTVVSPSCHVLVLCPHHVSVPVTTPSSVRRSTVVARGSTGAGRPGPDDGAR
jgi:hypothetical protein